MSSKKKQKQIDLSSLPEPTPREPMTLDYDGWEDPPYQAIIEREKREEPSPSPTQSADSS